MCCRCVCGVHRGQERALDALELESQTAVGHVGAGNTCSYPLGQLRPDNEYCLRFCSYCCYHILSSWIHSTVQLRASPLRSEQTDHWSSPSRQGSDSPTDLLFPVLGKTATPRLDTKKQFPSQPSFPGRCWRTPKQKACVFPQVLAHKGGTGREQRMLGTATKGPVNKVTKKSVWYQ